MNAPLLTLDAVALFGSPGLSPTTFQAESEHLLVRQLPGADGAKVLLAAFLAPSLIERGRLLVLGESVTEGLASGRLGYVPREWPEGSTLKVQEALLRGARLLGLGKSDVERAFSLTKSESTAKRRLADLSPLETRLVGLAHGILSTPDVLLLPDPFIGLRGLDAELLELLLEPILERTRTIASLEADTFYGRRLEERLGVRALVVGSTWIGGLDAESARTDGAWVRISGSGDAFSEVLRRAGVKVERSPREDVFLVGATNGLTILRAAASVEAKVLELTPAFAGASWVSAE